MGKPFFEHFAAPLSALAIVACGDPAGDAPRVDAQAQALAGTHVVAAVGTATVGGRPATVEVILRVPHGDRGRRMALDAVRAQGAKPVEDALHDEDTATGYTFTGLVWPGAAVTQYYDDSASPVPRRSVVTDPQATWNAVTASGAVITDGGDTTRCPSLVKECPGKQDWDGKNDVNWIDIKDRNTLGVTWSGDGTYGPEADMSLNTRFSWDDPDTGTGGDIDAETVMLHEIGHVLGIGHSSIVGAVMEPVYAGPRRALHHDDESAVTVLYPGYSCGNDVCELGEDDCSCAADCGDAGGEVCGDGLDNDCDGTVDCDDADCADDAVACPPPACGDGTCDAGEDSCGCAEDCGAPAGSETRCDDGLDDDCDGLVDTLDGDCPACLADGERCNDSAQCCGTGCYVGGGPPTCRTR